LGPYFGALADRFGRRKIMALGLVSQCIGMAGISLSTGWWSAVPMFLAGLAINMFLPAQQAYISDIASFERRGRALASVEISFAFTGIAVMPLIGWVMETWGWRTPFMILSLLSILAAILIWFRLPATEERSPGEVSSSQGIWQVFKRPNVLVSVMVSIIFFTAVGIFMTFWSIWLSNDFAFEAVALGLIATSIGVAELSGATMSGLFIDRLGKRRGSLMSIAAAAIAFLVIPLTRGNLVWIRVILVVIALFVEFCIVSLFALYGEQAPEARATIFSLVALGNSIGIAMGSPLTAMLWDFGGLPSVTGVGAVCMGVSFVLILLFLSDKPYQS
jgi:predicted MFS family arabinose efflux permease